MSSKPQVEEEQALALAGEVLRLCQEEEARNGIMFETVFAALMAAYSCLARHYSGEQTVPLNILVSTLEEMLERAEHTHARQQRPEAEVLH